MGTRAIITIDRKLFIATHWDGYPTGMGKELLKVFTEEEIIEIAIKHNIDFADKRIRDRLNASRIRELAEKHRLTEDEIIKGVRRGGVISANDYLIGDIKNYGDWAEYQYDFTDGKWRFRSIRGCWGENPKFGKWKTEIKGDKDDSK